MGSNDFDHPLKDIVEEEGLSRSTKLDKVWERTKSNAVDESMEVEYKSSDEESNSVASERAEYPKSSTSRESPVSHSNMKEVGSMLQPSEYLLCSLPVVIPTFR